MKSWLGLIIAFGIGFILLVCSVALYHAVADPSIATKDIVEQEALRSLERLVAQDPQAELQLIYTMRESRMNIKNSIDASISQFYQQQASIEMESILLISREEEEQRIERDYIFELSRLLASMKESSRQAAKQAARELSKAASKALAEDISREAERESSILAAEEESRIAAAEASRAAEESASRAAAEAASRAAAEAASRAAAEAASRAAAEAASRAAAEAASRAAAEAASRAAAEAASREAAEAAAASSRAAAAATSATTPAKTAPAAASGQVVFVGDSRTSGFIGSGYMPASRCLVYGGAVYAWYDNVRSAASLSPRKIVFFGGQNDLGVYAGNAKAFIAEYVKLIRYYISLYPNSVIYCNLIFPSTPAAIAQIPGREKRNEYNTAIRQMCAENGWNCIDTSAGFQDSYFTEDGIHFQFSWYAIWWQNLKNQVGF